jgi:hypothetical protein
MRFGGSAVAKQPRPIVTCAERFSRITRWYDTIVDGLGDIRDGLGVIEGWRGDLGEGSGVLGPRRGDLGEGSGVLGPRRGDLGERLRMVGSRFGSHGARFSVLVALAVLAKHGEVVGGGIVSARMRTRERFFGFDQVVLLGEEHADLEGAVGVAALVSPAIRRRRTGGFAAVSEQHAEVEGSDGVTGRVRAHERLLGLGQPVLAGEPHAKLERVFDIDGPVRPPRSDHGIGQVPARSNACKTRSGPIDVRSCSIAKC